MHRSTQKNILLWCIPLERHVVIKKSKILENDGKKMFFLMI